MTAIELARARGDAELVSVDSMAVYRHMDIGTAKPTAAERAGVAVHLIDLVEPSEDFGVSEFEAMCDAALAGITARGHRALFVGGTGLYVRAVVGDLAMPGRWPDVTASLEREADVRGTEALHATLCSLDPVSASRMAPTNRRRVIRALEVTIGSGSPFSSFGPGLDTYRPSPVTQVGIPYVAEVHDPLIAARFHRLVELGLPDEVASLASSGRGLSRTARQAIGYREMLAHIEGELTLDEAVETAIRRTRNLARRQWSWFRRDPRIAWLDPYGDLTGQLVSRWDEVQPAAVGDS